MDTNAEALINPLADMAVIRKQITRFAYAMPEDREVGTGSPTAVENRGRPVVLVEKITVDDMRYETVMSYECNNMLVGY